MTIRAKYPGRCAACRGAVEAGDQIEWVKGQPVRHTQCPRNRGPAVTTPRRQYWSQRRRWEDESCDLCGRNKYTCGHCIGW